MKLIKPTSGFGDLLSQIHIFLGGSIEMGAAENWQDRLTKALEDTNATLLNPRRDDWDSSWTQDPTPGTQFHEQVKWEMDAQDISDIIVYYFDPSTKAPITLLEMGTYGTTYPSGTALRESQQTIIVCCPDGFYRKGNVTMFCNRYDILLVDTFDELVDSVRKELERRTRPVTYDPSYVYVTATGKYGTEGARLVDENNHVIWKYDLPGDGVKRISGKLPWGSPKTMTPEVFYNWARTFGTALRLIVGLPNCELLAIEYEIDQDGDSETKTGNDILNWLLTHGGLPSKVRILSDVDGIMTNTLRNNQYISSDGIDFEKVSSSC